MLVVAMTPIWTLFVLFAAMIPASVGAAFCMYKGHVKKKLRIEALHTEIQQTKVSNIATSVRRLNDQAANRPA